MEAEFWHKKWEDKHIPFHQVVPNALLTRYFKKFVKKRGGRVFVPLCGKTHDIHWLLSQGYKVAGIELSDIAVAELFRELKIEPQIRVYGKLVYYSAKGIDVFVGDIFELSFEILGEVDAIYDRAAMVALPEKMQMRYAGHLMAISKNASQLLLTVEHGHVNRDSPPFSTGADVVEVLYGQVYQTSILDVVEREITGSDMSVVKAIEKAWYLS